MRIPTTPAAALVLFLFSCTLRPTSIESDSSLTVRISESEGGPEVTLANQHLLVRFGRVRLASGESEDAIVDFVIQEDDRLSEGEDQVESHLDEGSVQTLADVELIAENSDSATVRLTWHGAAKIQEATIYEDRSYIRLDYYAYPKWIVDIGAPGGITEGGAFAVYGSDEWRQGFVQYPEIYYDRRQGDRPGPLSYKGWFIGGVYNPENGRGFGRVMPMEVIDVVKLLWGGGIEILSFPGSGNRPFTGYLFAVTEGGAQIIERGQSIADQAGSTILGTVPPAEQADIPFRHVVIDTSYGGIRAVGDVSGDGYPDIVHGYWYDQAPLAWYEYHSAETWTPHVIRGDFYPQTDDFELADIDRDDDLDIIIARDDDVKIIWFENPLPKANPRTDAWKEHRIGIHSDAEENYIKDIEVTDVNGDGLLDVVTRANVSLAVFRQSQSGGWTRVVYLDIPPHEGMDVGDLDNDGDPDVILNGYWIETPDELEDGDWTRHDIDEQWFTQSGDWTANNAKVLAVDMSGDDRLDVLLAHSERPDYPAVWYENLNARQGAWTAHVIDTVDYCHTLQAADFDGDGDRDVLVGEMEKSDDPDRILVYRNDGTGMAWEAEVLAAESIYSGMVADVESDGDWDVIANRNWNEAPLEVWLNTLRNTSRE